MIAKIKQWRAKRAAGGPLANSAEEVAHSYAQAIGAMQDRLNATPKIKDLYKELGIEIPSDRSESIERVELAKCIDGRLREPGQAFTWSKHVKLQAEIGLPGTLIRDGRIDVEQNYRLRPYLTRGRISQPGTNEETYRTEPMVFKSVNEITALITTATYEPTTETYVDEETRLIVDAGHRAIQRIDGGFAWFLQNAATLAKHGFAPFELIWNDDPKEFIAPRAINFREQATVERWVWDEEYRTLAGVQYRTGGMTARKFNYTTPNGPSLPESRTLIINIHASGNNVEGVSPIRVIYGLRALKKLILQAFGISYQKYAVPIAMISHEMVQLATTMLQQASDGAHKAELQTLITRLQNMRSRLGAALPIPAGLKVDYVTPTGDMPDPTPMLEYIDSMMTMVFSNEGSLLGSQSFGSYAMASVADDRFMRAAPVYASRIADALTEVLHKIVLFNHSDPESVDLSAVRYGFRFAGTQDASKWLGDVVSVMGGVPVSRWPDEVRRAAATKLGLSASAFDEIAAAIEAETGVTQATEPDDTTPQAATPGTTEKVSDLALNGAQVTAMVEVVQQVANGDLPLETAIGILKKAFLMTDEEARALVMPAESFTPASIEAEEAASDLG